MESILEKTGEMEIRKEQGERNIETQERGEEERRWVEGMDIGEEGERTRSKKRQREVEQERVAGPGERRSKRIKSSKAEKSVGLADLNTIIGNLQLLRHNLLNRAIRPIQL